eukprot:797912-Amphidinium_carterae.1
MHSDCACVGFQKMVQFQQRMLRTSIGLASKVPVQNRLEHFSSNLFALSAAYRSSFSTATCNDICSYCRS